MLLPWLLSVCTSVRYVPCSDSVRGGPRVRLHDKAADQARTLDSSGIVSGLYVHYMSSATLAQFAKFSRVVLFSLAWSRGPWWAGIREV